MKVCSFKTLEKQSDVFLCSELLNRSSTKIVWWSLRVHQSRTNKGQAYNLARLCFLVGVYLIFFCFFATPLEGWSVEVIVNYLCTSFIPLHWEQNWQACLWIQRVLDLVGRKRCSHIPQLFLPTRNHWPYHRPTVRICHPYVSVVVSGRFKYDGSFHLSFISVPLK